MKQCPTCQKEFPDSMRFCQSDGTPLVEKAEKAPPPDPYKTVVGGSIKMDDDILQIPPDDPNKTMVSPMSMPKAEPPKSESAPPKPFSEPPKAESQPQAPPQPPKFSDVDMNAPKFGDLSASPSSGVSGGSSPFSDAPKSGSVPPASPFNDPPKSDSEKIFGSPPPLWASSERDAGKSESPFDKQKPPPSSSPFDKPLGSPSSSPFEKTPPPPYKEPEPKFGGGQPSSPFGQSPFDQPKSPLGQNEPVNQPFQQNEWTPPPAPVANWQDQGLGANTPFQPPAVSGAGGQNQTLPIISLVLGILSLCCYVSPITGIAALITGFLGMKNANNNPAQYGGKTLAIVGMILGGLFFLIGIAYWIFVVVVGFSGFIPS
jgi:hypothetical protein